MATLETLHRFVGGAMLSPLTRESVARHERAVAEGNPRSTEG
jgi:hypothetical protein